MNLDLERTYEAICKWADLQGIKVTQADLPRGRAGEFNGVSATMNRVYTVEERIYYLTHALGSMVRWSLSQPEVQQMFDELRAAKNDKDADPKRLEQAIERYREFETESSEFAVQLFDQLGHAAVIPSYTNFMRADLEALTQFHREGKAPVWRDFFAEWNEQVAQGRRSVPAYRAKSIPAFQPRQIEKQVILQEQPK